jgi:tetratricopeptide (TPR) repeat protein
MNAAVLFVRTTLAVVTLLGINTVVYADLNSDILTIQQQWARANYATPGDDQEQAFEDLVNNARKLTDQWQGKAEPLVWLAISLSTDAGVNGGFSALGKVKEARQHLEAAEKIDAQVLDGSVYTSLGSLYYQVPGWPIGFGDDDKAEVFLKKALAINPEGIDPNYFYGDFQLEEGNYAVAAEYLTQASKAPARPQRPLADKGRQAEIAQKLEEVRKKL